jgi:azurin
MTSTRWISFLILIALGGPAGAAVCPLSIEANDLMQFSTGKLEVATDCIDVELTLRNVGKQPAQAMSHNWVLVRSADLGAVSNAGTAAGRGHSYQQPGDPRIIAGTTLVGAGESTTVRFATGGLKVGEDYAFFCSSPGHVATMKGTLVVGGRLAAQLPK